MKRKANNIPTQTQNIQKPTFDKQEIISKQKRLQLIFHKCIHDNSAEYFRIHLRLYQKIKFKGAIYEIGDFVELYDTTLQAPYVGKLTHIVRVSHHLEMLPFIEVEWCMKKDNLPKENETKIQQTSVSSVSVPSNQKQYLYVDSIKGKCVVLSLLQYGQLGITPDNYYFSRAEFNNRTQKLKPDPSEWETHCVCRMPTNPDLKYFLCSKCENGFMSSVWKSRTKIEHSICQLCSQSHQRKGQHSIYDND